MHGDDEFRHSKRAALLGVRQIPYAAQDLVW
jgi:hypothetical protein